MPNINDLPTGGMVLRQVSDLDPDLLEKIQEHAVDWLGPKGERDWEDYLGRLEVDLDLDLPTQMDDPVIRRIQKVARDAYAEANDG